MPSYSSSHTGAQIDAAVEKTRAIDNPTTGKADLVGGIVKASQAHVAVSATKSASFTLAAGDAEKFIPVYGASGAVVITVPRDATGTIPVGSAFTFLRIGANAVSFAFESGLAAYIDKGSVAISGAGSLAVLLRISDTEYSLSCG
ncbi:MAG TPA: hypothetical protein VN538_12695 [Clostridia bacterium]|nr:hypothetical protein [Clostridia bacterium]